MQVDVVSPEKLLFSSEAVSVEIPGSDGDMTAMANHAPLITTLRPGILRVVQEKGTSEYVVTGGFAELGEKEFMACMNVTDMEAMGAFMNSPEELQWDRDNACEYSVYGMEEMTE